MKIKKFQEGGMAPEMDPAMAQGGAPMGPEAGAPMEAGAEQDPIMQIAQVAVQALQSQDCEAAMAVCQAFVQLIQQSMGGGSPEGPVEGEPQGEPVFKCGGKLKGRKAKKCANGIKIESKKGDVHKDKNRHDNRF